MKKPSIKNFIIVITTLFFFSILFTVSAKSIDLPKLPKNPLDLLKKKKTDTGGAKFDTKNAATGLVKTFLASSNNYLQSQELLLIAYGKNTEAAQVKEAIVYAKDSGVSDGKKMKNSIKVTTEASKMIETSMNDQSYQLTAEGKANYAKSLPYLGKGIIGTMQLKPQAQMMIAKIQSSPMNAFAQIGGLSKVIPNLPNYIKTITSTSKLIITGAKAKKIEGADSLDETMNKLAL
jgi:hypothetical protein|tara:strand:+ start:1044 stop:1745 length:702 start_codon:yes stop_codon:yes gene_type:complete